MRRSTYLALFVCSIVICVKGEAQPSIRIQGIEIKVGIKAREFFHLISSAGLGYRIVDDLVLIDSDTLRRGNSVGTATVKDGVIVTVSKSIASYGPGLRSAAELVRDLAVLLQEHASDEYIKALIHSSHKRIPGASGASEDVTIYIGSGRSFSLMSSEFKVEGNELPIVSVWLSETIDNRK